MNPVPAEHILESGPDQVVGRRILVILMPGQ